MREPKTWMLLFALSAACSPAEASPPSAPVTAVPVGSVSASLMTVEPSKPEPVATATEEPEDTPELAATAAPSLAPGGPFDRGRAAAALGAVNVQSCATAGGPRGSGHVRLTFANDGRVRAVTLDQGPFPGTGVGSCIMARFRGVSVPPFGGPEIRVGKAFTIN